VRTLDKINDEITADQRKLNAAQLKLDALKAASKPSPSKVAAAEAEVKLWTDAISRLNDEKTALATSEANNYKPVVTPPLSPSAADVSTLASEVTAAKANPNDKTLLIVGGCVALAVGAYLWLRK
jgi:phage repressor protein C with HTH and peptisase S24 domain